MNNRNNSNLYICIHNYILQIGHAMKTKRLFTFIIFISITLSAFGQATVTNIGTFNESNISNINVLDNGTGYAFSFGCTNSCADMNVLKMTNFDDNWQYLIQCGPVSWPDPFLIPSASHFFNSQRGIVVMSQEFAGYNDPGIFKTTDGGNTWDVKYTWFVDSGADVISGLAFSDDLNGLAITREINSSSVYISKVLRTTDAGETWSFDTISFTDMSFEEIIYVQGVYYILGREVVNWDPQSWSIFSSIDGGLSWNQVYNDTTPVIGDVCMQFLTNNIGFVCIQEELSSAYTHTEVLKTIDGGVSWSVLGSTASVLAETMSFNDLHFVDEQNGYIIAGNWCNTSACYRGSAILETSDGGITWNKIHYVPYGSYALYDVSYNNNMGIGYVCGGDIGTNGGQIFKITNGAVIGLDNADKTDSNINVYPNPSNGDINFYIENRDVSTLTVYSIDGRECLEMPIVKTTTKINLAQGSYLYIISDSKGDQIYSGKLLIH